MHGYMCTISSETVGYINIDNLLPIAVPVIIRGIKLPCFLLIEVDF